MHMPTLLQPDLTARVYNLCPCRNLHYVELMPPSKKAFTSRTRVAKIRPAKASYPVRKSLFIIAKQMYSAVFPCQSHFDPINLNANSIIGDSERDGKLFFRYHLLFGQHNTISNVIYRYSQLNLSKLWPTGL